MNRRDLLKRLFPAAAATTLLPAVSFATLYKPAQPPAQSSSLFHGWCLQWLDWTRLPNMDVLTGAWVAYDLTHDSCHLYSSWPGACGPFRPHMAFNLSIEADQFLPTFLTPPSELDRAKNESLSRLKRLILKVGPPPLNIEKYRADSF